MGSSRNPSRASTSCGTPAALSVKPAVMQLVRVPSQMTLAQFNQQYPSTVSIEELAIINELSGPEAAVPRGRTLKRVVGGRVPTQPQG